MAEVPAKKAKIDGETETSDVSAVTPMESEVTDNANETSDDKAGQMSKRARKKLAKRQVWLEQKAARRAAERQKRKLKMARMENEKVFLESRSAARKRLKKEGVKMNESSCKTGVVFDLQFAEHMNQKDLGKCMKQIMKCYSINRRLKAPLQLYITSLTGEAEKEMSKNEGYQNWDLHFRDTPFIESLPKESIVYLTSDSDNCLEKLEPNTNYVIGALVDHNRLKGICYNKAKELGVRHARLPIDEFIEMKTRKVLTVNHVYEIMATVLQEEEQASAWKKAFLKVIPPRKGAMAKGDDDDDSSGNEQNGEEEKVVPETIQVADADDSEELNV